MGHRIELAFMGRVAGSSLVEADWLLDRDGCTLQKVCSCIYLGHLASLHYTSFCLPIPASKPIVQDASRDVIP